MEDPTTGTDPAIRLLHLADIVTPHAVRVAATLHLPDLVEDGVTRPADLAERTGTDPDALARLLRLLVERAVFTESPTGELALTEVGKLLRAQHSGGFRQWLDVEGIGRADLAFVELLDVVRTGRPGYATRFGLPFWDHLAADPPLYTAFNDLMAANREANDPDLLAGYDWSALRHVVDVGGGTGRLLVDLLTAHPGVFGTLVDLPGPAAEARVRFDAAGLAARCSVAPGSFFDPLPAGADAYVLSLVLHDWDDADATRILRRCADAAGRDGRVLIVEWVAQGGRFDEMDLRMLVYCGGRERTSAEFSRLVATAGLELTTTSTGAGGFTVLECRPC